MRSFFDSVAEANRGAARQGPHNGLLLEGLAMQSTSCLGQPADGTARSTSRPPLRGSCNVVYQLLRPTDRRHGKDRLCLSSISVLSISLRVVASHSSLRRRALATSRYLFRAITGVHRTGFVRLPSSILCFTRVQLTSWGVAGPSSRSLVHHQHQYLVRSSMTATPVRGLRRVS